MLVFCHHPRSGFAWTPSNRNEFHCQTGACRRLRTRFQQYPSIVRSAVPGCHTRFRRRSATQQTSLRLDSQPSCQAKILTRQCPRHDDVVVSAAPYPRNRNSSVLLKLGISNCYRIMLAPHMANSQWTAWQCGGSATAKGIHTPTSEQCCRQMVMPAHPKSLTEGHLRELE